MPRKVTMRSLAREDAIRELEACVEEESGGLVWAMLRAVKSGDRIVIQGETVVPCEIRCEHYGCNKHFGKV